VLPQWGPFQLSAEAFWGHAGGFNGGGGQTVVVDSGGRAHAIESWGGFIQVSYRPNERVRCNLIFGIDDPRDRVSGVDVEIQRNRTGLANCFWRLLPPLDLAIEVQGVRTDWNRGSFGADDVRVTQAVYLNF
ncbi:MAG: hypothetical protein JRH10_19875, partial [Deltaproteobacteria bacterium]|nr:hypothetical protein [Deltaproteobacteria bacterium]